MTEYTKQTPSSKTRQIDRTRVHILIILLILCRAKVSTEATQLKQIYQRQSRGSSMVEVDDSPDLGYSNWSKWSACSKTCNLGRSIRQRVCHDLEQCQDGNIEVRLCQKKPCRLTQS